MSKEATRQVAIETKHWRYRPPVDCITIPLDRDQEGLRYSQSHFQCAWTTYTMNHAAVSSTPCSAEGGLIVAATHGELEPSAAQELSLDQKNHSRATEALEPAEAAP